MLKKVFEFLKGFWKGVQNVLLVFLFSVLAGYGFSIGFWLFFKDLLCTVLEHL